MKVFIDSGGWLSVIIESDQYHEAGRSYFETLMALGSASRRPISCSTR